MWRRSPSTSGRTRPSTCSWTSTRSTPTVRERTPRCSPRPARWSGLSPLRFRNVDADPGDDIRTWPFEALVTAIDRGSVPDWRPIFEEIRRSPWGEVARGVERHVDGGLRDGAHALFRLALARARAGAERAEREEVAARVCRAVKASWMTKARFAKHIGTSASRLSTYLSGKVTPSAAMLLRIEHTGAASHSA